MCHLLMKLKDCKVSSPVDALHVYSGGGQPHSEYGPGTSNISGAP